MYFYYIKFFGKNQPVPMIFLKKTAFSSKKVKFTGNLLTKNAFFSIIK